MEPSVVVHLSQRWVKGIVERHLSRGLSVNLIREISRETVFILENSLAAGQRVSMGDAVAEALDLIGFMADPPVTVTAVL